MAIKKDAAKIMLPGFEREFELSGESRGRKKNSKGEINSVCTWTLTSQAKEDEPEGTLVQVRVKSSDKNIMQKLFGIDIDFDDKVIMLTAGEQTKLSDE